MSACGWPEPSTGIRLPRGQWSQAWISRVSVFSSRIARSRYFSRISSSVAGTRPAVSLGPCASCGLHHSCSCARRPASSALRARARAPSSGGISASARRAGSWACGRCRPRAATRGTPPALEVAHADPHRAQALWRRGCRSPAPARIRYLRANLTASSLKADTATRALKTSIASMSSTTSTGARSRGRSACDRTGAGHRPARPAAGSRQSSPPASSRAGCAPR